MSSKIRIGNEARLNAPAHIRIIKDSPPTTSPFC
jgi:hypothetical protein